MTKQLEEELAAWMRRQADQSWNGADIAPGAFKKSRRIRRQRRIATVVVAAAALAGVVTAGTQVVNLATPGDQVVNTPTTSAEPTPPGRTQAPKPLPKGSKPIVLDFGKLPSASTSVPWWDARTGTLRWGEEELTLGQNGRPEAFAKLGADQARLFVTFQTTGEVGARLDLIDGDGDQSLTKNAGTFAVSADGGQIAFTTGDREVRVASSAGKTLHSKAFGFAPEVTGFVGDSVVVSSPDGEQPLTQVWDLDTDQVRTIQGVLSGLTTVASKGLLAVRTGNPSLGDALCNAVIDVNNGDRELWRGGCGQEVVSLSPDGRYAVLSPPTEGDVTEVDYTFVDLRNGRDVMKLQAMSWDGVAWEPDSTHVVLNAFVQDENAPVRCDLFGTCELVSDPLPWDGGSFYALPVN
jgi:hypothetical protein